MSTQKYKGTEKIFTKFFIKYLAIWLCGVLHCVIGEPAVRGNPADYRPVGTIALVARCCGLRCIR